jgi:spore germination protein KA
MGGLLKLIQIGIGVLIMKLIQFFSKNKQNSAEENRDIHQDSYDNNTKEPLKPILKENLQKVKQTLGNSIDIVIRELEAGVGGQIQIGIIYTDGLVDKTFINEFILESLLVGLRKIEIDSGISLKENTLQTLKKAMLPVGEISEISDFDLLLMHMLSGDTILLIDGINQGLVIGTKGWKDRGVTEPSSETVVRGPKNGFSETIKTNTSLLRRIIKDPNLWIETIKVGKRTRTDIAIAYIKGVAKDEVVAEVHKRLKKIDVDGILESGYIEELIQDAPYSPFPTVYNTERPDKVAAGVLEGRVAIFIDGTPFVLLVPVVLIQFFQASEDYYHRYDISSLIRIVRYLSFFLTLLVPSLYIAITTFHQEMLPTPLLTSIAAQREGVPFPAAVEAVLMEVTFEILREAGVRLPRAVGSAISIVGALVLGEAAVQAGIVSPIMVIVVSITAISNFVTPAFNMAMSLRIVRFLFLILASSFGLFGVVLGLITMVLHLCSLQSFGVPYMSPMAPFVGEEQRDALLRLHRFGFVKRPRFISGNDMIRSKMPKRQK